MSIFVSVFVPVFASVFVSASVMFFCPFGDIWDLVGGEPVECCTCYLPSVLMDALLPRLSLHSPPLPCRHTCWHSLVLSFNPSLPSVLTSGRTGECAGGVRNAMTRGLTCMKSGADPSTVITIIMRVTQQEADIRVVQVRAGCFREKNPDLSLPKSVSQDGVIDLTSSRARVQILVIWTRAPLCQAERSLGHAGIIWIRAPRASGVCKICLTDKDTVLCPGWGVCVSGCVQS